MGQAKLQFDILHKYVVYDLEVDTSILNPEECAQKIMARLQEPPQAFKTLKV